MPEILFSPQMSSLKLWFWVLSYDIDSREFKNLSLIICGFERNQIYIECFPNHQHEGWTNKFNDIVCYIKSRSSRPYKPLPCLQAQLTHVSESRFV
jgi:hypothetical protein